MPTLTVKILPTLYVRLTREAKRRGVSKSALTRASLEASLKTANVDADRSLAAYDLVKEDAGCFDSGISDLATNPKHIGDLGR